MNKKIASGLYERHEEAAANAVQSAYKQMEEVVCKNVDESSRSKVKYGLWAYAKLEWFANLYGADYSLAKKVTTEINMRKIVDIRVMVLKERLENAKTGEQRQVIQRELERLQGLDFSKQPKHGVFILPFDFHRTLHELHSLYVKPHLQPSELALVEHARANASKDLHEQPGRIAFIAKQQLEKRKPPED